MLDITLNEIEVLSGYAKDVFSKLLITSSKSSGDVGSVEIALESALQSLRGLLVTSALRVCVLSAERDYFCPACGGALCGWGTRVRPIVTTIGEGTFPSERYRCRTCKKDYYPWQTQQGLDGGNEFTLSARQLVANVGSDSAYDSASGRLLRMGIPVSGSEVDQICREVGTWRKQEEDFVRDYACRTGKLPSLDLFRWDGWPNQLSNNDVVVLSVDGGMVRSDQMGPKGLEWFEVRCGLIGLVREDKPFKKVCFGGDLSPDQVFEHLRTQWCYTRMSWNQKGARPLRHVFLADGAEWIWARAGWYFPDCIQVLDIFHAAAHVGAAARAAWKSDGKHVQRWVGGALQWLLEPGGAKAIIKALIGKMRCANAVNPTEIKTEFRYLWRHRHRMNYYTWRQQGLSIGSGAIESCIKQTSKQRLCQAGMMWTKPNADLMLHLRSAVLSNSLSLTVDRERRIRANRALQFRRPARTMAIAI